MSSINVQTRFSQFLREFKQYEHKMVTIFLQLVVLEYKEKPDSILGMFYLKD